MNIVFVGGGSFLNLPIVRSLLAQKRILANGSVRLVDLNRQRAETVGRLIQRTPEFAATPCAVSWTTKLDKALEGADAVYVTMPIGSPAVCALSTQACQDAGFIGSDQLSLSGAFRSLTGSRTVLDFARRMEKRCPEAWMLIFANPVAVYSGLVNNHTKIRALGVCMGVDNHRWDVPRLFGKDEHRTDLAFHVAGVNHLSFILDGTYRGKPFWPQIDALVKREWTPPRVKHRQAAHIRFALRRQLELYQRFGTLIFSTEGDGMAHLFPEEAAALGRRLARSRPVRRVTRASAQRAAAQQREHRTALDKEYRALLDADLDAAFWASGSRWTQRNDGAAAIHILRALAGMGTELVYASAPARGAVHGVPDRTVVEYSMRLGPRGPRPSRVDLAVPEALHGFIASLATHQTLLGDASATRDPRLLAQALSAYPVKPFRKETKALWKKLLAIHSEEIPEAFQQAIEYF